MVAASLLNIVLDPLLIYGLGLGIAGAAWGTVISLAAATIVLCYWFFIKKGYLCVLFPAGFYPEPERGFRYPVRGNPCQC